MFFRREKPVQLNFDQVTGNLKPLGFEILRESSEAVRVTRGGYGAVVRNLDDAGKIGIGKAGVLIGNEIAELVHGGYQMFLRTPGGKEFPAQAAQLKALHAFDEDLREGLGLTSLYNLSLGTTADAHMYDRVAERDHPIHVRPWEKKAAIRP